jgi:restriction system protein
MDITSQYPTELFELLADTIPLLCRSEEDILLFFREAGVGYQFLSDFWLRIEQVDDSVQKDEIVRTTLTRLNERGDVALRQRKAILEMVTEFNDFSHCLPDDQPKAQELVFEIRRLLGIKDDLTKVHLELEWE